MARIDYDMFFGPPNDEAGEKDLDKKDSIGQEKECCKKGKCKNCDCDKEKKEKS